MAKIIEINKTLYTVGITWRLRYKQKKSEIIMNASDDFDAFVFCPNQVGFLDSKKNEKHLNTLPLANSLKIAESSFIGIFHLQDIYGVAFYSLIIRHEDIIVGGGDSVFNSIQEVENKIKSIEDLLKTPIEKRIICETYKESLDFLEQNITKKTFFSSSKIKPLYKSKANNAKFFIMFIGILSLPIAYMSISSYIEYQEEKSIEDARLLFLQNLEKRKKELQENAENVFKQLWKDKALAVPTFTICQENLFRLPIVADGWLLETASCKNNIILTTWQHQNMANYIDLPFDGVLKTPKEVSARHVSQKQNLPTNQTDFDKLLSKNMITQKLYQITQSIGASIKIAFEEPESKEYKDLKITITSPWQKGRFSFEKIPASLLLNSSLYEEFDRIPSLYITEIKYNNQSKVWSIKGEFYVSLSK